jgi:hypothetical protein
VKSETLERNPCPPAMLDALLAASSRSVCIANNPSAAQQPRSANPALEDKPSCGPGARRGRTPPPPLERGHSRRCADGRIDLAPCVARRQP